MAINVDGGDSVVLSMSDEDMANVDVDALVAQAEADFVAAQEEGGDGAAEGDPAEGTVGEGDEDVAENLEKDLGEEGGEEATADDGTDGSDADDDDDGTVDPVDALEGDDDKEGDDGATSAKDLLAELYAPFTAIGKQVTVDNIADARQLMQMGIGYNKRMAAMKPHMQTMKTLEKHGIDADKLNFLIDLQNKEPAAIAKLVADSGIDPLDIPTKDLGEYKPNTYNVSEKEVDLSNVVDEIRESEHYETTSDIVSNKWDETSQEILVNNPGIIRTLNEQVGNGQYDQISQVVESERMFNRLSGLSDIEAYQQVGLALAKAGTLKGVESPAEPKPVINAPKVAPAKSDNQLKDRKRAASSGKAKPASVPSGNILDPLNMPDDEFEAAMAKGLFNLT